MKIGLYMYDRPLELDDEATDLFLEQYEKAKEEMKRLLGLFDDEETRVAMFHMMSLRCFIDDFLEFCTVDIDADDMEELLNGVDEDFLFGDKYEDEDDDEILVEFDDEEE